RTVDNGRIGRIGNVVVAFVSAHRMPVTEGDRAVVAAACDGHGAGILLAGIDPVGEAVVGGQMIELPGRLVVPAAPRSAAVDAHHRALVGAGDHAIGVERIDPDVVIIV